jgi:hypothetical protein
MPAFEHDEGIVAMSCKKAKWVCVLLVASTAFVLAGGRYAVAASGGQPIPLPGEDKKILDKFLGKGVVGKAVVGKPMDEPLRFVPLENTTWRYRMTSGDLKGKVVDHKFSSLERDPSGATWKAEIGDTDILMLRKTETNNVEFVSHPELDTGLITTYDPPAPLLVRGAKPGDSGKVKFNVKVYYMDNPGKLKHEGYLELKLSYVGAYEVTTPAGKFEAALVKSDYQGKVGPAKVSDVQYRFLAEGVGVVAMIEQKDVSAYLLYKDHTKIGKVLEEIPAEVAAANQQK